METIKAYLDSMFAKLPDTSEVRKAKEEIWQMMEDQYHECMKEGNTESEAAGKVISEFGSLEELAEGLGIKELLAENADCATGKTQYIHPVIAEIMSVYWATVTALYLSVSFLSFEWGRTWIIWPLAVVIYAVVDMTWKEKNQ